MDKWKSRGGKRQRRARKKKEDQRREGIRRKKMQAREKAEKSRNTMFFPMFCGSGGSKVGMLKQRVRSHLGRWEMKNCTPLWRKAHFEVKTLKIPRVRGICESWNAKTMHAVVARSTFGRENSRALWKLRVAKVRVAVARSAFRTQNHTMLGTLCRCGAKHIRKSKALNWRSRNAFGSWDVEKVHGVVARSMFASKKV